MIPTSASTTVVHDGEERGRTERASRCGSRDDQGVPAPQTDTTCRGAVARQRARLQGYLSDLQSEYEDAALALATGCQGGLCVARGVLQAHVDACADEMATLRVALDALDTLDHATAS
jgi:hypothetical protein